MGKERSEQDLRRLLGDAVKAEDSKSVIAVASALLQKRPDDADALVRRAQAWTILGEFSGACADFARALELEPSSASAIWGRSNCLLVALRPKEAEPLLDRLIGLHPKVVDTWLRRALARTMQGNIDGAEEDYREALRLEPANPDAQGGIEQCETERKKQKEAKMYGEPRIGATWWGPGKSLVENSEKAEARRQVSPLVFRLDPANLSPGTKARFQFDISVAGGGSTRARKGNAKTDDDLA